MSSEGYCGWSVCQSVKSHLTSGASVRPKNTVTYSAGNVGQKICGVFSETAPLRRSSTPLLKAIRSVDHFPAESAHAHYSNEGPWISTRRVLHFSAFIHSFTCTLEKQLHNIVVVCAQIYVFEPKSVPAALLLKNELGHVCEEVMLCMMQYEMWHCLMW